MSASPITLYHSRCSLSTAIPLHLFHALQRVGLVPVSNPNGEMLRHRLFLGQCGYPQFHHVHNDLTKSLKFFKSNVSSSFPDLASSQAAFVVLLGISVILLVVFVSSISFEIIFSVISLRLRFSRFAFSFCFQLAKLAKNTQLAKRQELRKGF